MISAAANSDPRLDYCSSFSLESIGISKHDFSDHKKVIDAILPLAEKGDGTAQHFLASRLLTVNPSESLKWAKLSFESGCIDAAILMGTMFDEGMGVSKNPKEAFKWYLIAAKAGDVIAAGMVSQMYYQGNGVDQNEARSLYWI